MSQIRPAVRWASWGIAVLLVAGAARLAFTDAAPDGYGSGCGVAADEFLGTEDEYGFRDEPCIDPRA